MAKIPTADALDTPRLGAVRPLARIDSEAFAAPGRALQSLAGTVGQIGGQFAADAREADAYEHQKRFVDFDLAQENALEDAKRSAPENPGDFTGTFMKGYGEAARGFLAGVPANLKPKFDDMLVRRAAQYEGRARGWEGEARDAYHANDLGRRLVDLNNLAATKPDDYRSNIARGISLIDAAPIAAAKKMALRGKFASEAEAYAVRAKIERGEDLDAVLRDLGGEPASLDADENPETRAKPFSGKAAGPEARAVAPISFQLETGQTDPLKGVSNISRDSNNSRSYGNFGLNSQGSAQRFVREYGGALGLTGKPGTDAFDRSWREAAASNPEALHKAEMAWFQGTVAPRIAGSLTAAGVPEDIARDPRVQAYFGDRLVQYGPASIDNHAPRMKRAADQAGGDPVAFLRAVTEQDRAALEQDFPSALRSGVYGPEGHDNRLGGRLRLALEAQGASGEDTPAYSGPYRYLSADQRLDLIRSARARIRAGIEGAREQLKQSLDDDVESIRRTGVSGNPDIDAATRVLEPNQINRYRLQRQEAEMEFAATRDLPSLPDAELQRRLDTIEPKPGEKLFEMKAKIFDKVNRAINGDAGLRKLRESDPARAVEDIPDVRRAAESARANPDDPEAARQLVRARLEAQGAAGVPDPLRSPITRAEAHVLTAPLKGLEGKALTSALADWRQGLEARYGPYARATALSAIEYAITRDKDLAEIAEGQINRALSGMAPSAAAARRAEFIAGIADATRAFGAVGAPSAQYGRSALPGGTGLPDDATPAQVYGMRQPPARAIEALRANPALAPEFNAHYGDGAAEVILAAPQE